MTSKARPSGENAPIEEVLRRYFEYRDGMVFWKAKTNSTRVKVGARAGFYQARGYRSVRLWGKVYKEHRLIWLLVYGKWPSGMIDHINCITDDNRIENLREASPSLNSRNRRASYNRDLPVGVYRNTKGFKAQLTFNRVDYYFGTFTTPEEALKAYTDGCERVGMTI